MQKYSRWKVLIVALAAILATYQKLVAKVSPEKDGAEMNSAEAEEGEKSVSKKRVRKKSDKKRKNKD